MTYRIYVCWMYVDVCWMCVYVCVCIYIFKIKVILFFITFHTPLLLNIVQVQLHFRYIRPSLFILRNNKQYLIVSLHTLDRTCGWHVYRRVFAGNHARTSHCNRTGENFVLVANTWFLF